MSPEIINMQQCLSLKNVLIYGFPIVCIIAFFDALHNWIESLKSKDKGATLE